MLENNGQVIGSKNTYDSIEDECNLPVQRNLK